METFRTVFVFLINNFLLSLRPTQTGAVRCYTDLQKTKVSELTVWCSSNNLKAMWRSNFLLPPHRPSPAFADWKLSRDLKPQHIPNLPLLNWLESRINIPGGRREILRLVIVDVQKMGVTGCCLSDKRNDIFYNGELLDNYLLRVPP